MTDAHSAGPAAHAVPALRVTASPRLTAHLVAIGARRVTAPAQPPPTVASTFAAHGDRLVASCPACGDSFLVPTNSVGTLIGCSSCPWQGTVGQPFD